MSCEDQAVAHTHRCVHWSCGKVQGARVVYPSLVRDERGYWCCPSCKGSYGASARGPNVRRKSEPGRTGRAGR